jgi:hypothetical protein
MLKMAYETVAYVAEQLVFIFLGLGIFAFKHPVSEMGSGFFILTVVILAFSRLLNVGIISCFINCFRRKSKLSAKF